MRKRIGSRGFKNYSKSYQKKLLTRLRKEINKNYTGDIMKAIMYYMFKEWKEKKYA